jgi:alpha-ketoglutarate-dependent taurine dioxygenase
MPEIRTPTELRNYVIIEPDRPGASLMSVDFSYIRNLYVQYGALLFRGFDLDLDVFSRITRKFCSKYVRNNSYGRQDVDHDVTIQSVDPGVAAFPLHLELARVPWRPDIAWFACIRPPTEGGETVICDGVDIADNLPAATRHLLENRRLLYKKESSLEECRKWLRVPNPGDADLENPPATCPFTFSREQGRIYRSFTYPILHKPMFTDKLAFGNYLLFARYHNGIYQFPTYEDGSEIPDSVCDEIKAVSDRLAAPVTWHGNDLLMLDNTRFMHGRNQIIDVDERLIYTQFGYLHFAIPSEEEPQAAPWRSGGSLKNGSSANA